MNIKRGVIGFFILIFLIEIMCANFEVGNLSYSFSSVYGPNGNLSGWINLSFSNEDGNKIFEDSLGNNITLIDLLESNLGLDYSCVPSDCSFDYLAVNGETSKSFDLQNRQSRIIGLKFSGEINSIDSVSFVVESDATSSCYNQLSFDILNDGVIDFGNNKGLYDGCSSLKSYGCFNESVEIYNPTITTIPYCQRVTVFESPGLFLGAWVSEEVAGDKKLTAALYDLEGELKGSCFLPKDNLTGGREVQCGFDYLITSSEDYYVCIYSDSGTGEYRTKGYSSGEGCGFNGFPVKNEVNAYQIFAEVKAFAAVGVMNVSNSIGNGNYINGLVSDYIVEKYGSFDCSSECVVPIRIVSGKNQDLTIKDLNVIYSKQGLTGIVETNFYDLDEAPAKITSDFQKVFFDDAQFVLPEEYGSFDYSLDFDGEEIISETFSIENVPLIGNINPSTTASAYPTKFIVHILNNNSVSFNWDFGDNESITTEINEVTHTYSSSGVYSLKLDVTDSFGRTSYKIFAIKVVSPEDLINSTIIKKFSDLENVKNQISNFNSFYQEQLNGVFDFDTLEDKLKKIEKDYEGAFFEEEYNEIMTDLLALEIPELVLTTKSANSILSYSKEKYIDLYILETIGGGTYDIEKEGDYINEILLWNQENLETRITFREISARYGSYDTPVMKFFEIDIKEVDELGRNPYFVMEKLEGLSFKEDYLEGEESGFVYIELEGPETIEFSTTEDIDFTDLPFFISPEIEELFVKEVISTEEEETFSKWVLFSALIFLLLVAGIVVYLVLQAWYKTKYETHLFKNRNNLYNLVVYIQNARKKGIEDKAIYSKLRKAGWTSEQVNYAMRKHAGKRTGMFELPIGKVLDKLKKKGVLDKKRPSQKINFRTSRL